MISQSSINRFWVRVEKLATECGCWLWTGYCDENGYGGVTIGGKRELTHRVAWILTRGNPGNLHVLHTCDTPSCCNPNHLFLGTNAENVRDMVSKGRNCHGERSPMAKINTQQVIEIQTRYAHGESQENLAKEFGVSRPHVSGICSGDSWKRVQVANLPERPKKKLLPSDVLEIRQLWGQLDVHEIARRFGVSKWAIYDIMNGKRWSDLQEETR